MKRTSMQRARFSPRIKPMPGILRTANLPETGAPKLAAKPRMRKCTICRAPFAPMSMMHKACGPECALALVQLERSKAAAKESAADRKETKAKLLALKGLSYWEGRAQHAVNKFIRLRDAGQPCISCDITYSTVWQAGHYISVGANSTLRYVEDNIHLQCVQCNLSKSGNATPYRVRLVAKIGLDRVEALHAWHNPVKSTIEQCQAIEAEYIAKLKQLLAERG